MSEKREMKKIDLNTLGSAQKKISASKVNRVFTALILLVVVAGGAYGAYRLISGDVEGTRFTVTKMVCPACIITVKEAVDKVPGVVGTDVSLAGQEAVVKFMSKRTSPERIKEAIAGAGYPCKVDGVFKSGSAGAEDQVIATVNGRPVFKADLAASINPGPEKAKDADMAAEFFSAAGKEILLQAANAKTVVVQPQEVDNETEALRKALNLSRDEFLAKIVKDYGSLEQFYKVVAQRIGLRKLFDEYVLEGVKDPGERQRKTMEWLGETLKAADVKVLSGELKEKLRTAAGHDKWNTFWPRMIPKDTELKRVVMR